MHFRNDIERERDGRVTFSPVRTLYLQTNARRKDSVGEQGTT